MQKGNETRSPLLKIEFKKVLSWIEYFFSIKKLNRYNISIGFSSTTRYLQRKIIPLSDLQFTDVPTFLGHPILLHTVQYWKQFSRCEELTRLSSSLDTSLSRMVRRFRMKRPAREFHADLNERRDEREFKTRATDHKRDTAAAPRSGRSEIDILLSGPASKFPSPLSPPPPILASVLNIHQVPAFRDSSEPNFTVSKVSAIFKNHLKHFRRVERDTAAVLRMRNSDEKWWRVSTICNA